MAKRTKFKSAEENTRPNNDKAGNITPESSDDTKINPDEIVNNGNNNINAQLESSGVNPDDLKFEQFYVVKNNIVKNDDYIKFKELAEAYYLFNKIDLNKLNNIDLISLVGLVINDLFIKKNELEQSNNKVKELQQTINSAKPESSFSTNVSYGDLLNSITDYKSWN